MDNQLKEYKYCYDANIPSEWLSATTKTIPKYEDFIKGNHLNIDDVLDKIDRTPNIELGYILSRCLDLIPFLREFEYEGWLELKYYKKILSKLNLNQNEIDIFNNYLFDSINKTLDFVGGVKQLESIKSFIDLCIANPKYFSLKYLNVLLSCKPFHGQYNILYSSSLLWFDENSSDEPMTFDDDYKKIFDSYDKNKSEIFTKCTHNYNNLVELCFASLYNILKNGCVIKKCPNCKSYFVPLNRTDTIYCNRISPQDKSKTCKEYGALQSYKEKLKSDKASGLYRSIYMQKQMLVRRNPDIQNYKDDFEDYKIQSRQWKLDVKNYSKSEEDFIKWLESIKSNK